MSGRRRTLPSPPDGLSRRARALWRQVVGDYQLEAHHLEILRAVCTTADRLDQVRAAIAEQGVTVPGSKGQPRANTLLTEERGLNIAMARLVRELDLDEGPSPDVRPPRR